MPTKAAAASADQRPVLEGALADPDHRLDDDRQHGGLEAEEQRRDDRNVAPARVDVAERHDGDDAGQDEQPARHDAAERAMHQPADIGGELLRLGARQQHAVVERVQKPLLGDPALLLDQDAVHHRDLPGGAAEAQRRDAHPGPERLAQADAMRWDLTFAASRGHRSVIVHHQASGLALGQLWVSLGRVAAPAIEGVVERHGRFQLREIVPVHAGIAERRGEQAFRLRREVGAGRVGAAHDLGELQAGARTSRPNSSIIVSKVQVSPRWLQNTPSMSKGVALKRSATAVTSDGWTKRNTAFGSMKRRISQGQAMRSTLGRVRVTQTVRPLSSRGGSLSVRTSSSLAFFQASKPPSSVCASMPSWRSQAAVPSLSFWPLWQTTTTDLAPIVRRPARDRPVVAAQ